MYICIYVCMCVCLYVCMYVCRPPKVLETFHQMNYKRPSTYKNKHYRYCLKPYPVHVPIIDLPVPGVCSYMIGSMVVCVHTMRTYNAYIQCVHTMRTYNAYIQCIHTMQT